MGLLPYMAVFVKVVELGSLSAAAEHLGTNASSVSRQLAQLEEALAIKLLERTTRKLKLTEAGAEVYQRCCALVTAGRSVMEVSETYNSSPYGMVKISAPKAYGRKMISPLIPEFLDRYPSVDVQLILTDSRMDLMVNDIDLMVRITDSPPLGLAARLLSPVSQVLCATEKYLSNHGTPTHPTDLIDHSCLYLGEFKGDNRWELINIKNKESITVAVKGRYVTNHSEARLDGVLAHLGIGCFPLFTAQQALSEGKVQQVLPEWQYATSYYGSAWILYQPNKYLPSKCRVLIDHLVSRIPGT
nr:LysR family transcriptional regulator [Pseudomonas luteola]